MQKIAVALLLCGTSLSPRPALAWDDEGHRIVALVADHYLTPATKKNMEALLQADSSVPPAERDIASAAGWADRYRDSDKDDTKERYNATYAWHFANIQAIGPDVAAACFGHPILPKGTLASKGPAKACIIDKIDQFSRELSDPKTSAEERKLALKFVLNLMGDVHQPLRVADEDNAHGLGTKVVSSNTTPGELFNYWDSSYVHAIGTDPQYVARGLIAAISDKDARAWASGNAHQWALEAYQLGVNRAYGYSGTADARGYIVLPDEDVGLALQTIRMQLARAGVRLAYVLNTALAQSR